MNIEKRIETRQRNIDKMIAKRRTVEERNSWTGRARQANSKAAEMFDTTPEPTEDDLLDFGAML